MPIKLKAVIGFVSAVYDIIVCKSLVAIGAFMMVFMMLSIGGSVAFRGTAIDFSWALEASEYMLILTTLFGAGWLVKTGGHIRVDMVPAYLHGKARELYECFIFLIIAVVCLCFTLIGIQATWLAYLGGVIEEKVYFVFPKWILLALFPMAGFSMFVESTKIAIANIKKYLTQQKSPDR